MIIKLPRPGGCCAGVGDTYWYTTDTNWLSPGQSRGAVFQHDVGVRYSDPTGDAFFDFNGDGLEDHVVMNDWTDWWLLLAFPPKLQADFDSNGEANFDDFLIHSGNFGAGQLGDATPRSSGDANQDGLVSFADFLILSREFG